MQPPFDGIRGKVVLVTGGAGGLGRAHATLFARLGASVVVNDTGVDKLGNDPDPTVAERVAAVLRESGAQALADTSDVGTFTGAAAAVQRAVEQFGRIDILINNAGTIHGTSITDITEDELMVDVRVHSVGTVGTMRAAFPHMVAQGWGRIVNTLSEAALHTDLAAGVAYSTAKSAVWGATMSGALAGRGHGITVNALSPGAYTRMSSGFLDEQGIPPGLDLSPERVSEVIAGLCTDAAGDITGRVVHTAGGHVREFVINRVDDSDTVLRLREHTAVLRQYLG